jgi:hypothetical protein
MGIRFTDAAGSYLPERDAIRITGVDGERLIECTVTRSALEAIGCGDEEGRALLRRFERERDAVEVAAMVKYRRALKPATELTIEAEDLAVVLPAAAA